MLYNRSQKTVESDSTDECEKAITYFRDIRDIGSKINFSFLRRSCT